MAAECAYHCPKTQSQFPRDRPQTQSLFPQSVHVLPVEDSLRSPDRPAHAVLGWVLGCALVYSALFGTGNFLYGKTWQGIACMVPFALSAAGLVWVLNRMFREERAEP